PHPVLLPLPFSLHDALPIFIILYPLLRQLSAAVMHPDDMYDLTVNWIPRQLTRLNFEVAWKMLDYPRALVNTVGVTGLLSTLERSEEHTSELQSRENLVCRL